MAKRAPTNAELEILRVLWQRGASTVRDVHESLDHARPVGYTTVLKLLQIMVEKGLVRRDASARSHVYTAVASQEATRRRLGLMLALPLASGARLSGTSPWTDAGVPATSPVAPGPTSGPGPQAAPMGATPAAPVAARIRAVLERALPWVVLVWFGGVVAL